MVNEGWGWREMKERLRNAWSELEDKEMQEAMAEYVELALELVGANDDEIDRLLLFIEIWPFLIRFLTFKCSPVYLLNCKKKY